VRRALRRLLFQGALRVALVAITTAGLVGFLSLIARASQSPGQMLANGSSRACMPKANAAQGQRPFAMRSDECLQCSAIGPPVGLVLYPTLATIDLSRANYFLRTPASVFPRLCVAALAAGVSTALP
jgi:hypothetical protein